VVITTSPTVTTAVITTAEGKGGLGRIALYAGVAVIIAAVLAGVMVLKRRPSRIESKIKYCTECGSKIPVDAEYCPNCGAEQRE
jgi:ribosomal protein L40E